MNLHVDAQNLKKTKNTKKFNFFRKTKFTDLLGMILGKIFKNFFWRASTWRAPDYEAKFSDLLFLVVATNKIYRFFLFYLVGVHLKNFARARAPTL